MNRLAWLLVVALCTAFGQVQPVAALTTEPACECCVEIPGACGMADCASLPAAPASGAGLQAAASRETCAEVVRRQPKSLPVFQAQNQPRRASASVASAASRAAAPASAPLYRVHCSFLL